MSYDFVVHLDGQISSPFDIEYIVYDVAGLRIIVSAIITVNCAMTMDGVLIAMAIILPLL